VLQSPEGGFLSVGNRRFRIRRSVTPPLTPVSVRPLEGVPVTMPANTLTERIPPRARSSRFSTLAAATDKITISRNVLFGLCLTTFAFGIVTTLAIDHMHARASEAPAPREPEPVVLQTTPIEPLAKPAPAAALPAPPPPSSSPQPSPSLPASSSPVVLPQAAAADAVVVQLPPAAEKSADKSAEKLPAHLPAPPPSRGARPIAAAPLRATPTIPSTPRNRMSARVESDSSSSGTEAAPDEDPAMPTVSKKKWVDPFDQ
jgi:predicted outer membrane lipoprotein